MNSSVNLYDTTLRDGSQGEGINFSVGDKLRIARRLDAFGMHYIEGGWPGSNDKDMEFFAKAKTDLKFAHARLAAFGSTRRADLPVEEDKQVRLLLEAETPVVTIFGKTWLLHVIEALRTTPEENLAMIADTVAYLKSHGREVIYDAEHCFDGFKDNSAYAVAALRAAAQAGASHIVLCDTNGGCLTREVSWITGEIISKLGPDVKIGIHTHDDSGLGVSNALAAVDIGATQVQGTINGYGERTGNCNLTTVIANLQLKMGHPVVSEENLRGLRDLSLFVDEVANQRPFNRAPFVGPTAFAHKGGMHVNAINKLARTYEHIVPAAVGNQQRVLMTEQAGRTNVMLKARDIGLPIEEKSLEAAEALSLVKKLENEGYEFESADASFELLMRKVLRQTTSFFTLHEYHVSVFKTEQHGHDDCEATIKIEVNGDIFHTVAEGDGPVNALDAALRKALSVPYPEIAQMRLTDFKVRILDGVSGSAAKTRVLIESTDNEKSWSTVGVSYDIIEASWLALRDSVEYKLFRSSLAKGVQ